MNKIVTHHCYRGYINIYNSIFLFLKQKYSIHGWFGLGE